MSTKSVLMVCLGNICRSPLAEGVLREKAKQYELKIHVDSAGTSNFHINSKPDKRSIANAKKHKIDISILKARQFHVSDFDDFDHILVMDNNNYHDIIKKARNEEDISKVELILNYSYPNSKMAVPDPYYGAEEDFEQVFQLLDKACEDFIKSVLIP
jgi:protein-tyrosine phosphatase